jgi:hypothetical protein
VSRKAGEKGSSGETSNSSLAFKRSAQKIGHNYNRTD